MLITIDRNQDHLSQHTLRRPVADLRQEGLICDKTTGELTLGQSFSPALTTLPFIFQERVVESLPAHIVRCIGSPDTQGNSVIDNIAWALAYATASGRTWVLALELVLG